MPSSAVKKAINEVQSQTVAEYPDPATEQPTNPSTPEPEKTNPLNKARQQMKRSTKLFIAGGVLEGMDEILVGDFSGIETEINDAVATFSERVAVPKLSASAITSSSSSFFALNPAK